MSLLKSSRTLRQRAFAVRCAAFLALVLALAGAVVPARVLAQSSPTAVDAGAPDSMPASLKLWHTFPADSPQEALLAEAVREFEAARKGVSVDVTRIPYLQNLQQFINSAQGGEAPDLIRLSDTEVGKIGHISVEGLPLLEDLRPHLTPAQRAHYEPRSLAAMRYGEPLFALPVSQGCLALLYNKSLFDAAGVSYPRSDWTTADLLAAATALTQGEVRGISLPLKWSYWFLPFQWGFGAGPFDEAGNVTLDSPGTDTAVEWFLDLDRIHGVVASGVSLEAMSTQFQLGKAAMVLDGPWAWNRYVEAGLDIGLAVMPTVESTGLRLAPMLSYFGWGVSKQSAHKVEASALARWLTSDTVQKRYALSSNMLPVQESLLEDPEILANPVLAGFLEQTAYGRTVPTNRASAMLFEQLDTALDLSHSGKMATTEALAAADAELEKRLSQ
ncbi:MAG: extracellular solute-binding protein [Pseudomonadota bacterium]